MLILLSLFELANFPHGVEPLEEPSQDLVERLALEDDLVAGASQHSCLDYIRLRGAARDAVPNSCTGGEVLLDERLNGVPDVVRQVAEGVVEDDVEE